MLDLSAFELAARIRSGELSSSEVVAQSLDRAEQLQPRLSAFIRIDRERALAEASRIDKEIATGQDVGVLAGVPVAVKDNICTSFKETTA